MMDHPGRKHIDQNILSLIDASHQAGQVLIHTLKAGDVIELATKDALYVMTVIDPQKGTVFIEGFGADEFFIEKTPGRIQGTTLSGRGTMLKMGSIIQGYSLVIFGEGMGEFVLPTTLALWINNARTFGGESSESIRKQKTSTPKKTQNEVEESSEKKVLLIEELSRGDVLVINTLNSVYTFTIEEPQKRIVTAHGTGNFFQQVTKDIRFIGSVTEWHEIFDQRLIRPYITRDMRLVFWDGIEPILLSKTTEIRLNGERVLL